MNRSPPRQSSFGVWFAAVFVAVVAALVALGRLSSSVLWIYIGASVVAFFAYGFDKGAAAGAKRRISERTLHLLALGGGWPGALAAQRAFRHKTRKLSFRLAFWLTALVHCGALGWWLWTRSASDIVPAPPSGR
jgi:uncharacterized membrane protein YsdA (DUF1294 family)